MFVAHEQENAKWELPEGSFGKLLKILAKLNDSFNPEQRPIHIALVTVRNTRIHERVIHTLRAWSVNIDEAFFMDALPKEPVLRRSALISFSTTSRPMSIRLRAVSLWVRCLI